MAARSGAGSFGNVGFDAIFKGFKNEMEKSQKLSILDNADPNQIYVPTWARNTSTIPSVFSKEAEALMAIFNNRKQAILSRKAAPGINQTRFE